MVKLDTFLWITMGMMLVVFMPVGLIMLAYLMIKTINQMINPQIVEEEIRYKESELSPEEAEQAR